ncbi:TRAP transporter substrate-binding protein [bacterium LRH843]|nr:TRAP transporter substrate-binding protein [bacterium LRH843]
MKRKKIFTMLTSVVLASSLVLVGCGSGDATGEGGESSGKARTIKVAHYFAEDHPQNIALKEKFKPLIEEGSEGALKVEIYPNSQLGAEEELYNGVRNGTIEMGITGLAMQSSVEKLLVPEMPFLFKDYEHVQKVLNGPIGDELAGDLVDVHGVKPLAWSANGFRSISSNKPLASMDDFKGLRLRMPNIPNYIDLGHRLGATVSPLAISEVFTGLEQKVIDGQDNPIATVRSSGWYEVQSDVLESNHMFSPNIYIINNNLFNELSPELQQLIQDASIEAANYEFELMEDSYETDKAFLEEHGITFTTPDDAFRQAMADAANPMYEDLYSKYDWAKDIIERIKAEAN